LTIEIGAANTDLSSGHAIDSFAPVPRPLNHACISGAVGRVLDAQFPDANGRYYAMGMEAGESQIYGGIHYRIDVDEGFNIAQKVAARALAVGIPTDRPFVPRGQ